MPQELNWLTQLKGDALQWVIGFGIRLVVVILILVIGFKLCKMIDSKLAKRKNWKLIDSTLRSFLLSSIRIGSRIFVVSLAMLTAGIAMSSFLAILGTAGLAVGLALQGALSNVAAGVLIISNKPYRVGDYIETKDIAGTVTGIGLFYTYLTTADNRAVIAPNNTLTTTAITNYGIHSTRRFDFDFGITYDADIAELKRLLMDLALKHPLVLKDPEPLVALTRYDASSLNVKFRVWVPAKSYWDFAFDIPDAIKRLLDEHQIEIPFPQLVIHELPTAKRQEQ
ncbi:MAG: mechanosensitive ion channel family protein [Bacillota bacterium]|nr:mechanosensitive ion channel family protein [Bacillota bacterium]